MPRSLPYLLLLAGVGLFVGAFLYILLDQFVEALFASSAWNGGGEHATRGRSHLETMWSRLLLLMLTSAAASLIVASRRGGYR